MDRDKAVEEEEQWPSPTKERVKGPLDEKIYRNIIDGLSNPASYHLTADPISHIEKETTRT